MFCYLEMDVDMDDFNNNASSESLPSVSALFSDPQDPAHFKCDMSLATSESLPSISVLFDHLQDLAHLEYDMSSATSVYCEATISIDSCPKCATGPGICDQYEWEKRRYPSINWLDLLNRVEKLQPWLEDCLEKKDVLIFRDAFIKNTKTIKPNHDFVYGERSGYYGPRGEALV
jgi:hypothetical protein